MKEEGTREKWGRDRPVWPLSLTRAQAGIAAAVPRNPRPHRAPHILDILVVQHHHVPHHRFVQTLLTVTSCLLRRSRPLPVNSPSAHTSSACCHARSSMQPPTLPTLMLPTAPAYAPAMCVRLHPVLTPTRIHSPTHPPIPTWGAGRVCAWGLDDHTIGEQRGCRRSRIPDVLALGRRVWYWRGLGTSGTAKELVGVRMEACGRVDWTCAQWAGEDGIGEAWACGLQRMSWWACVWRLAGTHTGRARDGQGSIVLVGPGCKRYGEGADGRARGS